MNRPSLGNASWRPRWNCWTPKGVDGLTMRRLADRLGSGVMSLYWHVDNKEDVFDLALDSVLEYRGPPQTAESQDWRGEVVHMLEDWRASMLRHPWSASLLPRRALGPNILSRLELLSKTLSRAGVADADLNVAIWSLWNYVMGATITRASFDLSDDDRAAAQQRLDTSQRTLPDNRTLSSAAGQRLGRRFPERPRLPARWPLSKIELRFARALASAPESALSCRRADDIFTSPPHWTIKK